MWTKLFPAIHMHWKSYKTSYQAKLKELDGIVLAGDGRHDSMGHSAKILCLQCFLL